MRMIRTAAALLLAAGGVAGYSLLRGSPPALPAQIRVCEEYSSQVCGTWTRQRANVYAGTWEDGATAEIRLFRASDVEIEARRTDSGKNPNFTAVYRGAVRGRSAAGQVTWNANGNVRTGFWTAQW